MIVNPIEKIESSLTYRQVWKDGIWLQEQVAKKRISMQYLSFLQTLIKCLDEVYKEKYDFIVQITSFDLLYDKDNSSKRKSRNKNDFIPILNIFFHPVIKFDSFFIENNLQQKIQIKDLFVLLKMRPLFIKERHKIICSNITYKKEIENSVSKMKGCEIILKGARTTYSETEFNNNYVHSHLPSLKKEQSINQFDNFCTGEGEINFMLAKLNSEFTENNFKILLFQIISYLEWESLEGRPHMKLEKIFLSTLEDAPHIKSSSANDVARTISESIFSFRNELLKLDYKINLENEIEIVDNEKLEECLIKIYKNIYSSNSDSNLCYKDTKLEKYYSSFLKVNLQKVIPNEKLIIFQNKVDNQKLEDKIEINNLKQYINPKIKFYVKQYIQQRIKRKQFETI
jgi:hypothetical protein